MKSGWESQQEYSTRGSVIVMLLVSIQQCSETWEDVSEYLKVSSGSASLLRFLRDPDNWLLMSITGF